MATGSWERGKYDTARYDDVLSTNNKRINLIMENPGICDPCRVPEPGFLGKTGVSIQTDRPMIDIESDLLQQGRRARPHKPYCPDLVMSGPSDGLVCGGGVAFGYEKSQPLLTHLPECPMKQIDSRTVLPACTLRGTGFDRWTPLCSNPQNLSTIEFPAESNINYKQVLRDIYRPCYLTPWDQTACLPNAQPNNIPCMPINGQACASFIGDLQPDRYTNPWPLNYKQGVRV